MGLFDSLFRNKKRIYAANDGDEFCPRCDANLTLQKGYHNDLPYWTCLGCGEMLINPRVDTDTDIAWICDNCESMLNEQPGFTEDCGTWKCTECGYVNKIDESEVYLSEEERIAAMESPYYGMDDEDVLELTSYEEISSIEGHDNITLVRDEAGDVLVKKVLDTYDESVYQYLMVHPIAYMPRILSLHKGAKKLIVLEEYIDGITLLDVLDEGTINDIRAVTLVRDLCKILKSLHTLDKPIIHRDVKPSNVIIDGDLNVYLLDVNAAKWYKPEETEDTKMLGTRDFAAPEQAGFGLNASTAKTDIYALGVLLNMLVTGRLPKEEKAGSDIWRIVDRCIRLNPEERYSDEELITTLDDYLIKNER